MDLEPGIKLRGDVTKAQALIGTARNFYNAILAQPGMRKIKAVNRMLVLPGALVMASVMTNAYGDRYGFVNIIAGAEQDSVSILAGFLFDVYDETGAPVTSPTTGQQQKNFLQTDEHGFIALVEDVTYKAGRYYWHNGEDLLSWDDEHIYYRGETLKTLTGDDYFNIRYVALVKGRLLVVGKVADYYSLRVYNTLSSALLQELDFAHTDIWKIESLQINRAGSKMVMIFQRDAYDGSKPFSDIDLALHQSTTPSPSNSENGPSFSISQNERLFFPFNGATPASTPYAFPEFIKLTNWSEVNFQRNAVARYDIIENTDGELELSLTSYNEQWLDDIIKIAESQTFSQTFAWSPTLVYLLSPPFSSPDGVYDVSYHWDATITASASLSAHYSAQRINGIWFDENDNEQVTTYGPMTATGSSSTSNTAHKYWTQRWEIRVNYNHGMSILSGATIDSEDGSYSKTCSMAINLEHIVPQTTPISVEHSITNYTYNSTGAKSGSGYSFVHPGKTGFDPYVDDAKLTTMDRTYTVNYVTPQNPVTTTYEDTLQKRITLASVRSVDTAYHANTDLKEALQPFGINDGHINEYFLPTDPTQNASLSLNTTVTRNRAYKLPGPDTMENNAYTSDFDIRADIHGNDLYVYEDFTVNPGYDNLFLNPANDPLRDQARASTYLLSFVGVI